MSEVSPEEMAAEIQIILRDYGTAMNMAVDEAGNVLAKDAARELRQTSPKGYRGRYAKGWKVKKEKKGTYVVYNSEYRLTHLLEHGHKTRKRSGRYGTKTQTAAQTHIAPVAEKVAEEFPGKINEHLKIQK